MPDEVDNRVCTRDNCSNILAPEQHFSATKCLDSDCIARDRAIKNAANRKKAKEEKQRAMSQV